MTPNSPRQLRYTLQTNPARIKINFYRCSQRILNTNIIDKKTNIGIILLHPWIQTFKLDLKIKSGEK